ncbi:hypothetical protein ACFQI7_32285 [Paenibacillus allorhizosphaerae]|uniref:Uncharacterized protein n=1 Tax=Paenibacillus allorhizosphaerae TaxID=2849866 RepID=A0ABM8VQG8_9BACL|nr:hypothetical protein [Paenibacillus allorhizosphaerae]CAG7654123.1 hypothetical protein PAECIP111802_05685 [Paenibacillus allorhizosphaerae]
MRYKYTRTLTLISIALCILHFFGHEYDPIYLLFYALSVPAWFYPIFKYTHINPLLLYMLTILSWAVIGYVIDRFAVTRRSRSR